MQIGGATSPMTDHHDGVGRKLARPQLTMYQQGLEPGQWFHHQAAQRDHHR